MKEYKTISFKHPYSSNTVEEQLNINAKEGYTFKFHQVYCDESLIIVMEREVPLNIDDFKGIFLKIKKHEELNKVIVDEVKKMMDEVKPKKTGINSRVKSYNKYKCKIRNTQEGIKCNSCASDELNECKIYNNCRICPCNKCLKCEYFVKEK